MAITVALTHRTEYRFDRLVSLAPHIIRLRPAPHTRTPVHRYALQIEPADHFINWQQDPFGNYLARVVFPKKTRQLSIEVGLVADLVTINPLDFFLEPYAEHVPFQYEPHLRKELAPYFEVSESGPKLTQWLSGIKREKRQAVDFLVDLNRRLQGDIGYAIRMEPGVQSCEETLTNALGSCRDSGWLLVQILRHLGLAARFVSGYLVQLAADVKSLDGPSGPEQDFTDLHAWAEVYIPGAGWIGLDPTSGLFAGEGHIPLACTPDPVSAAPVTGAVDKCETEFVFANKVTRIRETPRVTFPFDDEQWQKIDRLGDAVDRAMHERDVRLTMGGEPTFVSIDDAEAPEWNTAALGEHKRERAEVLLRRLFERMALGGLLHYGQGKWYPGEPLPRWTLSCVWRVDGHRLWNDPQWLADPTRDYGHGTTEAEAFGRVLARRLGLRPTYLQPGYEDGLYYLWKEGALPTNVDVLDSKLRDPLERTRLRRLFEQGLDKIVGYTLPLGWDHTAERWRSSEWRFRREHCFLLPGDSPMGLRLPLDSLLWEPAKKRQHPTPRDPFEPRESLPASFNELHWRYMTLVQEEAARPNLHEQAPADLEDDEAGALVRTALCIEPRDGRLYIFMPPITHLEHFLDLTAAIEAVAAELKMPVVLEGYAPPHDQRLQRLQVTPDPGVIEVNVPPIASWRALVDQTELIYEEARQSRLGTEKFMLDGRHTGTGGGNHVTIGGATPAESPILRRPHLLSSLITYWQHHPSLSYLFSGMFVGPTSQAPRVDEARDQSLYELEIAFQQLPRGDVASPWVVDRVLRNLLTDMTGNTHRSEFCIDKLYSPDSPTGRLGIVEFRAFEMPPHWRMSCVQMLLLRALIARFWDQPYEGKPVRWGTELHDRFLLPHFTESDFADVIEDLRRWGYPFERHWFDAFTEFRFPRYGTVQIGDVELELRFAIEPWHVLGEEVTAQGTARFVDSSVERLQVKAMGMTADRHLIACNGRRVPLRATARRAEFVAGVRYKAWNPSSALHPTIDVHAPLVFDVVDTWSGRSLGGCTYHVAHPGGRNYETFPVNANEAESRRLARFFVTSHTPGPLTVTPEAPAGDHPYTLDLRYQKEPPSNSAS